MKAFVSHSARDSKTPEFGLFLEDLNRMRQSFWIDDKLRGGQPWWNEILKQIRESDFLILVLTKRSIASEACRRELKYAADLGKPTFPLRLEEMPDWQLPDAVSLAHVVDYTHRAESGDAGVTCAFALRDAVDQVGTSPIPALPDPLPPPPEAPPTRLHDLQPFLQAKELSFAKQEEFLQGVRSHLNDEDEDRKSLVEVLEEFEKRPDVFVRVARDINELLGKLALLNASQGDVGNGHSVSTSTEPPAEPLTSREREPVDQHSLADSIPAQRDPEASSAGAASDSRVNLEQVKTKVTRFQAPSLDVEGLGRDLSAWYETEKLESHVRTEGGRVIVQCRSKTWTRRVGAGAALTTILTREGNELTVEIGGGKWVDKVTAAGVGAFVVWPALIPAALGGWKQAMLPAKTIAYIERMIPLNSRTP